MYHMYQPEAECMPIEQLRALQLDRLQATAARVYKNVPAYKAKFDAAGVKPEDIRSLEDLRKFPFTYKQDFRDNYPYGLFAVPLKDVVRIHASSGTTGKQKVVGYTRNDLKVWGDLMARTIGAGGITAEDIGHISYGYGLFTGGLGAHLGSETLGGMTVPAVIRYGFGFVQGADAAADELGLSDVEIKYVYGGQFFGDADITAVMDTWYGAGTEAVFACGGGIYTSAAEAAVKTNGKVIGVDVDQAPTIDGDYGAGMTITSAMKGLAPTVRTLLSAIVDGNWDSYKGKIQTLGMVSENPEHHMPSLVYQQIDTVQKLHDPGLVSLEKDGYR